MPSLTEIIKQRKTKERQRQKAMSKEEMEEQVTDWCDFYRRNWDIYAEDELGLSLKEFQKYALHEMGVSDRFFFMCGRGLSKSWMAATTAFVHCMLYPNARVVIVATTKDTSKRMFEEKMQGELCSDRFSKKLNYLYEHGYIKFTYPEDKATVEFTFNGSTIVLLPEVEASAGKRATMIIMEEVRLSKQHIINRIFRPMKYARKSGFTMNQDSEYFDNPKYVEKAKEIYLTSTSYNYEWWFARWKDIVEKYFKSFGKTNTLKYRFFAGDIFTSIYHGFTTQEEFDDTLDDPTMSEDQIKMEYFNEPMGGVSGSFYNMEKIKANCTITNTFVYPTYEDFMFKYGKDRNDIFRKKGSEEIRAICVDFASTDTLKSTQENDNTVIICMSGSPNKERTHIIRNIDYIMTLSGGEKDKTLLSIRELFYYYNADVFVYDNQQVGGDRFQELSKPYYHEILGIQMNGFGIYGDIKLVSNFCDETKALNLMTKVVDSNSIPCAIPVVGSSERNQNFHIAMQKAIDKKYIFFPEDEINLRRKLSDDKEFIKASSTERANRVVAHKQMNKLAVEATELQKEIKNGYIRLFEINHHPKDRIITAIYGNYFFTQLELKMLKGDQQEDLNEEDFYDIYDVSPSRNIVSRSKINSVEEDWENAFY